MKFTQITLAATVSITMAMVTVANAAPSDEKVAVHGYGDTCFLRAADNNYTNKFSGNDWGFNYLSVNFTAQVDTQTKIVAQIRQGSEITGDMGAYLNHNLTDNLTLRAGQIKTPIGNFNEIRDIKFLQLSVLTPLMYQDSVGYLPDSFKGAEAIYHMDMGTHRVTFDIYGGEPKGANNYIDRQALSTTNHYYQLVQNIYGGRLTYKTPIGLKFALSGFQNNMLSTFADPATPPRANNPANNPTQGIRKAYLASLDYRKNDIDFKTEYAYAKDDFPGQLNMPEVNEGHSYYAQIGYTFSEKLTPYFRYDYLLYSFSQKGEATLPGYEQKTRVLGFNYRLNNNVSMRVENQWNQGYAQPATAQGSTFTTSPKLDWNLFAMGINFIF